VARASGSLLAVFTALITSERDMAAEEMARETAIKSFIVGQQV
jgi:hypothetical protein